MSDLGATILDRGQTPFSDVPPEAPNVKSHAETNKIIGALTKSYAAFGIGLTGVGKMTANESLFADGVVLVGNAEDLAESWRTLLDNDPKVRRALKKMIESSGWASVIAAHSAVVFTIVKENHPDAIRHLIKRKSTDASSS